MRLEFEKNLLCELGCIKDVAETIATHTARLSDIQTAVEATAVNTSTPTTITAGSATMTGAAIPITTTATSKKVDLQALSTNANPINVGGSGVTGTTGIQLLPGETTTVTISDPANIYAIGTAPDVLNFVYYN